jgi:hypothetical protein
LPTSTPDELAVCDASQLNPLAADLQQQLSGISLLRNGHPDAWSAEAIEALDFFFGGVESSFRGAVGDDHQAGDAGFIGHVFRLILANAADGNAVTSEDVGDVGKNVRAVSDCETQIVTAGEFFAGLQREWLAFAQPLQSLEGDCRTACRHFDKIRDHG